MQPVTQELLLHFRDVSSPFYDYHQSVKGDFMVMLARFLNASMDEVRLRYAAECSRRVLNLIDMDDADHFRRGLLRREMTGAIDYVRQRDHSAHTLYNYLLGWYVYALSKKVRETVDHHMRLRGLTQGVIEFGDMWPFASLTHDIGYLFEGSFDPLTTSAQNTHLKTGLDIVRDYFAHTFWASCSIHSVWEKECLLRMSKTSEPMFRGESLSSVADGLRAIGDLELLRSSLIVELDNSGESRRNPDQLGVVEGLPGDAFDVWRGHYEYYGLNSMIGRVSRLERIFEFISSEGLGASGLRFLDHAVCSGMLLLQMSTFYHRVHFGLDAFVPTNNYERGILTRFKNRYGGGAGPYTSSWWWSAIVWATSATALHNVQQLSTTWPDDIGETEKLQIEEDPIAYLGILVDCLQEWDRYTVSGESVIGGALPLQGVDVELGYDASNITIAYHNSRVAESVRKSLDVALADWESIVIIVS